MTAHPTAQPDVPSIAAPPMHPTAPVQPASSGQRLLFYSSDSPSSSGKKTRSASASSYATAQRAQRAKSDSSGGRPAQRRGTSLGASGKTGGHWTSCSGTGSGSSSMLLSSSPSSRSSSSSNGVPWASSHRTAHWAHFPSSDCNKGMLMQRRGTSSSASGSIGGQSSAISDPLRVRSDHVRSRPPATKLSSERTTSSPSSKVNLIAGVGGAVLTCDCGVAQGPCGFAMSPPAALLNDAAACSTVGSSIE
mmetsp:Transcript_93037/g.267663  ORF Transcript_93037/g.267663 Transcript_93037/m.267663 type:complete len:249 (+) Transcript_93037:112-858(+)